jgi:hypothetical protein
LTVLEVELIFSFKTETSGMKQSKFTERQIVAAIKKMYAEVSFDLQALKNVVAKKW